MTEEDRQILINLAERINAKVKELQNITDNCWVCQIPTNNWIAILPETEPDGLNLGVPAEGKSRIAFAPVCKEHDYDDTYIKRQLVKVLKIKAQKLKN